MVKPPVLSPDLQEGQGGYKGSGKETDDLTNKHIDEKEKRNISEHQERWKMPETPPTRKHTKDFD